MNPFLVLFVLLLVAGYLVELVVELLNLRHSSARVPDEFLGVYEPERYARSQRYLRDRTRLGLVRSSILTPIVLGFVLLGGLGLVDSLARSLGGGMIATGLLFCAILGILSQLGQLPFGVYATFAIEARYGFNRTSPTTFVLDRLKGLVLAALVGGPMLAGVLWFFAYFEAAAWIYAWLFVAVLQLGWTLVAPVVIFPLFNRFEPLEPGGLRDAIHAFAREQQFDVGGVFRMDGSRRSTKANAFFAGFGRWRRIVLFDTLIEKQTTDELLSILAHEIGHFKLRHVPRQIAASLASAALMFFVLSQFLENPGLYQAFGLTTAPIGGDPPLYAGLVLCAMLYGPIALVPALWMQSRSRKYEYDADRFAVRAHGRPEAFISALKKLSVDSLVNLTPHPWKVFLEYGHPPMLARIAAIRGVADALPAQEGA